MMDASEALNVDSDLKVMIIPLLPPSSRLRWAVLACLSCPLLASLRRGKKIGEDALPRGPFFRRGYILKFWSFIPPLTLFPLLFFFDFSCCQCCLRQEF